MMSIVTDSRRGSGVVILSWPAAARGNESVQILLEVRKAPPSASVSNAKPIDQRSPRRVGVGSGIANERTQPRIYWRNVSRRFVHTAVRGRPTWTVHE